MKKYYCVLLLFCLCLFIAGCSKTNRSVKKTNVSEKDTDKEIYYHLGNPSKEKESINQAVRTRTNKSVQNKTNKNNKKDIKMEKENTVKENYFDDALFIGDSRTEGFGIQSGIKNAVFYTDKGLKVDTIFTKTPIEIDGRKTTIMEAVKKKQFKKIYIMFGINELGWPYDDIFIKKYGMVIDELKKAQPNAVIYIQSIIHVSKKKEEKSDISNKKINKRNQLIKKMAQKKQVEYLNLNEVLTNKNGFLFEDASVDGVHLNPKYCQIWKEYLLGHTKS